MTNNINQKVGKATVWSSITEVVTKLISPIVNVVLARLLVPEEFGIVATINMVISFAELFTDAGFQKYIVQHEFQSEEDLNRSTNVAFWTNLTFSCFACAIIFVFRHKIAELVGNANLGNSISIASVAIILVAFSSIQMARYKRDFDFKTLFFVRIGTSLIPLIITIPFAIVLRNYWALLIGSIATQLFNAVVLTWKSKWKPRFYYNFGLLKEMFSFSAWTLFESIAIWLTANIDIFIVGSFLSDYYLGIYKTTITTVNSYTGIITAAIIPVLFSALSRCQNDEKAFKSTYYSFQKYTAILVIPMGIGIWLFSDLITDVLLGSQWEEATNFMGIWGFINVWTILLTGFPSEVYRSKGQPKISLIQQIIHLTFLIPTLWVSVRYGFEVLYIARSMVRFQNVGTSIIIMHCLYKFKVADTLKNILPMLMSSIVMGIIGLALKGIFDNYAWHIFVIVVCIVVYFAFLFTFFPALRKDLLNKLHKNAD